MKNFILHDAQGYIVNAGFCGDDDFLLQAREGLTLVEATANVMEDYWDGGQVVPKGLQPSVFHKFNYESKTWKDPRTLVDVKAAKWQEIRKARDMAEVGTFPYMGKQIQGDNLSILRIERAVLRAREALELGEAFSIEWRAADNTPLMLDALGMINMPLALASYSAALNQRATELKELINSEETDTIAAVNAIKW